MAGVSHPPSFLEELTFFDIVFSDRSFLEPKAATAGATTRP
jgi:hypothetical protein